MCLPVDKTFRNMFYYEIVQYRTGGEYKVKTISLKPDFIQYKVYFPG